MVVVVVDSFIIIACIDFIVAWPSCLWLRAMNSNPTNQNYQLRSAHSIHV